MKNNHKTIRYAVVGLGHIAQNAVLPAFASATENSSLAALISDDADKLRKLGRHYGVTNTCSYAEYEACLNSGVIDAVYIALPNSMHREYVLKAARAGVHVLCEKPLATTGRECQQMIDACAKAKVKLMTAYRLHLEKANMEAVEIVKGGKIGEPRIFQSLFTMQVEKGNIRLDRKLGGGALYDIGIYCINAARYLFRNEPVEVFAFDASNGEPRFAEVPEMTSAILRFPGDRLASFTCSFGAADTAVYTIVGTEGVLTVNQGYEYAAPITMELTIKERTVRKSFPKKDQFAAELVYFSNCVINNREPEPSGTEGLLDIRVITSLLESARKNRPVKLKTVTGKKRPTSKQVITRKKRAKPLIVKAEAPSR
ncbi:MAG: oxidoreductase domain protein [Verrucomicrobia bacterium]|jgi:glucose-fructose oxidoreductase|nr:oxidoreductase domain protein [Verrucomicrobiota bacterium]